MPGFGQGPQGPPDSRGGHPGGYGRSTGVSVAAYLMLFLLGIAEGVVGSFQYSHMAGAVPLAALIFCAVILLTCVLGGWGMLTPGGALMPAAGWFVAAFVLAMGTPSGSVVITNSSAGAWFLFGGAICAAAGVVVGFVRWPARRVRRYRDPVR
jgi:hypothetical protein